jgi:hypothetical protein
MPARNRATLIGMFVSVLMLSAALTLALVNPVRTGHTRAPAVATAVPRRAELDLFIQADCSGVQCGLSGDGGEHFWVIASYAAVIEKVVIPRIEDACDSTGPELGAVCAVLGQALDRLVEGERALTNHGVWGSVYLSASYKGSRVQDSRY